MRAHTCVPLFVAVCPRTYFQHTHARTHTHTHTQAHPLFSDFSLINLDTHLQLLLHIPYIAIRSFWKCHSEWKLNLISSIYKDSEIPHGLIITIKLTATHLPWIPYHCNGSMMKCQPNDCSLMPIHNGRHFRMVMLWLNFHCLQLSPCWYWSNRPERCP